MEIKEGFIYHIKDEFFDIVNDETLMSNHERGKKRPTYFVIKEDKILWFIPLSSKVEKYQKIVNKKKEKFGFCNTIIIADVLDGKAAILLQNAFPTLEKYIDHVHLINNAPARVPSNLKKRIMNNFKSLMTMKKNGTDLFFSDIDKLKTQMLNELAEDYVKQ